MNTLSNAERETHINMTADDRGTWEVFSDDPVMIARLDKITTAVREVEGGKFYRLPANQVTLRKPKKPLTDKQRQKLAERLAKARNGTAQPA